MATKLFITLTLSLITLFSYAQDEAAQRQKNFNLESGPALAGYDPVSYFNNKPVKGTKELQLANKGVTYWFVNKTNLDTFKKNPAAYESAYGGWCAYAMGSNGEKVEVDPETYKIINGKLYLFYNAYFNNTLKDWNKDEVNLKKKADSSWQKIITK
jgi:YHS domain-containing protein